MAEIWKTIPGYEGYYEVSDLGRVRSLDRLVETRQGLKQYRGRVLRPKQRDGGYREVNLSVANHAKMHFVHKLVMSAFVGPCPDGLQVLHGDDNGANNRLLNLSYDTPAQNMRDQVERRRHWQIKKVSCPQGHLYTRIDKNGYRRCVKCDRAANRRSYHKRAA